MKVYIKHTIIIFIYIWKQRSKKNLETPKNNDPYTKNELEYTKNKKEYNDEEKEKINPF